MPMLDMRNSRKGEWHSKSLIWSNGQTSMATFILKRKPSFLQRGSSSLAWRALKNGCGAPIGLLGPTPTPTPTLGPLPNPLLCIMCCRCQLKPIFLLNTYFSTNHAFLLQVFSSQQLSWRILVNSVGNWNYHVHQIRIMSWRTNAQWLLTNSSFEVEAVSYHWKAWFAAISNAYFEE